MFDYDRFVSRNDGYVERELQERIRSTCILVAGCGVGSSVAEAAVRLGFQRFILADGDRVDDHNLNRQDFTFADVGRSKVSALATRLRAINPAAEVEEFAGWVTPDTASQLVARADVVLDTIDFLSLSGIVALHDASRALGRPVVSGMSAGWGAAAVYFAPDGVSFRELFGLKADGPVQDGSYSERYGFVFQRLASALDPAIVAVMAKALTVMEDGKVCPASQISAGAAALAALATAMIVRLLSGEPVAAAPRMALVDFRAACSMGTLDLSPSATPTLGWPQIARAIPA